MVVIPFGGGTSVVGGLAGVDPDDRPAIAVDLVRMASLQALAAGRSQVVTGWQNKVMTFLTAKLPKPLIARAAAKVLGRYQAKQVRK